MSTEFVQLAFRTTGGGLGVGSYLPLSAFASAQQFQQVQQSVGLLQQQMAQVYGGVAAAIAIGSAPMPSAPGRFSWTTNAAAFETNLGAGFSVAYRLATRIPIAITASYGSGGTYANVGRIGLMGEF